MSVKKNSQNKKWYWDMVWNDIVIRLYDKDYLWVTWEKEDNWLTINFWFPDLILPMQVPASYFKKFNTLIKKLELKDRFLWLTNGIHYVYMTPKGEEYIHELCSAKNWRE